MKTCRAGLVAGILLAFAGLASAQAPREARTFDIPPGALAQALIELGRQADVLIVAPSKLTAGKTVPSVKGEFTVEQALERLLEGTGLKPDTKTNGRITLVPVAEAGNDGEEPSHRMAQAELMQAVPSSVQPQTSGTDAVLEGQVMDGATGRRLAGALVRLVETGQTTRTDDSGNFRFQGLAPGHYTVSISYLGYPDKLSAASAGSDGELQAFVLGVSESAESEMTVYGTRSARAKALNLQRTADNSSSVISSDVLGNFPDATLSEALRRAPGIAFQRGALGDGQNVIIRGLNPDMNNVQLNGINLPSGNGGLPRVQSLTNFLADNIEKVTINETLLPSMDSAGTGGLIQIETKSPLGRPHRYANLGVDTGRKGGEFGSDLSASGTLSGTFGSERNFGLGASVQYLRRKGLAYDYELGLQEGQYLPLDPFGRATLGGISFFDPRSNFPFEAGVTDAYVSDLSTIFQDIELSNRSIALSGEWQVSDSTHLQLDVQRSEQLETTFSQALIFSTGTYYQPLLVQALNEERQALNWDGTAFASQRIGLNEDQKTVTDIVSFRGQAQTGAWRHEWTLGYAQGHLKFPHNLTIGLSQLSALSGEPIDSALISSAALDPVEQRIISVFGRRTGKDYPLPLLSDTGWNYFRDPANYGFESGQGGTSTGTNRRYTGNFATRWNPDRNHLKYIELGASFEVPQFGRRAHLVSYDGVKYLDDDPYYALTPLSQLGLAFEDANLHALGISSSQWNSLSRSGMRDLFSRIDALSSGSDPLLAASVFSDPNLGREYLREYNLGSYLQTRIDAGKLSFVGGVRLSQVRVKSARMTSPTLILPSGLPDEAFAQRFTTLRTDGATVVDPLPRFQLNYRQTDNLIFRGGYYLSTARPDVDLLSSDRHITLNLSPYVGNPDQRPELTITEGNPSLKPAVGQNFDLTAEYYTAQIGLIKLSGFYKQIRNILGNTTSGGFDVLDGVPLPDDPHFQNLPGDLLVIGSRPINLKEKEKHWGVSFAFERQLTFLPGLWSGFGVYGNYTYSNDRIPQQYTWYTRPLFDDDGNFYSFESVQLDVDPKRAKATSGTASITYNRQRVDGSLAYSWQGASNYGFSPYGLHRIDHPIASLDLRIQYQLALPGDYRVVFEGSDLLKGVHTPDSVGQFVMGDSPVYTDSSNYLGGRTFRFGLTASF